MNTTEQRLKEMGLLGNYREAQERVGGEIPKATAPLGSKERSQQLIARSKALVSQSKGMLSTSDLGDVPTLPDIPYEEYMPEDANKSVSETNAEAKGVTTSTDILLARLDALDRERETAKEEKKGWLEKMTAKPEESYEDKKAALMEELGIKVESDLVKQQNIKVATLQGDLNKIELQQREEIDRAYDRPTAMPNIRAEISEINRAYDRKKAYKAVEISSQVAILQAYQGNLNMSYDSLDSAIKGWMWDYEENRKRWEVMYDYHSDYLDDLTADHRKIYDMAYDSAVRKEKEAKESADYKRGLWADAAQRGVYLNMNEILDMTDDEAADLYAKKVAAVEGAEGTTGDVEAKRIEEHLLLGAGEDGKVNPYTYLEQRTAAKMHPAEFDRRFAHLLSPIEQENLGIKDVEEKEGEKFIDEEYIRSNLESKIKKISHLMVDYPTWKRKGTEVDIVIEELMNDVENWRDAGYGDKEIWDNILKKLNDI
ncbi:MAG: hypothetical protein ACTSQE_06875 [Candidatus Heimdallarchaeaceae archaeon]